MKFKDDEWKRVKIEDLGEVIGGGTPSTKVDEFYGGNIPWITPKDLSGYTKKYIFAGERNITDKGLKNSSAKLLPKGTVLFSSRAPIGYIAIAGQEVSTNQGFKSVIPDEEVTSSEFLYYLLKYNTEKIINRSSGSTFKEISGKSMKNVEVVIPNKKTQSKISNILSAFDEKIEVNDKIIANLEEQAQAIFKSWFIDFEPFQDGEFVESELGLIPEGWKVYKLEEFFRFVKGKKVKKESQTNKVAPYLVKGVVDGAEIPEFVCAEKAVLIDFLDSFMLMDGANSGNIYYGFKGALGSTFSLIETKTDEHREFIYWFIRINENEIKNQNTGSAIPHANKDYINNMLVALPQKTDKTKIFETLKAIRKKAVSLKEQNKTLAEIRDTLLPKLMSGEIDVSNINIDAEEECHG